MISHLSSKQVVALRLAGLDAHPLPDAGASIGEGINRREYWKCVNGIAEEAQEEEEDSRHDFVYESVDGSAWVIYTYRNLMVLQFSEWDGDGAECLIAYDQGLGLMLAQLAFLAMQHDVEEAMAELVN